LSIGLQSKTRSRKKHYLAEPSPAAMSSKNVVSDAEWVEARVAFMQLEAEHKAATIALAKKRQIQVAIEAWTTCQVFRSAKHAGPRSHERGPHLKHSTAR
jgi:hypothetical protein